MENNIVKIKVGSQNIIKIKAVEEMIKDYSYFEKFEVVGLDVESRVGEQPLTLTETIKGAVNRSQNSFKDCKYSFGIESGLMEVPETGSGYMDICVCSIFDGQECYLGISSAWEVPKKVAEYILNDGLDMNDAAYKAGLTKNEKIGSSGGVIGILTKGKLNRKEYTKEAIRTALVSLEN